MKKEYFKKYYCVSFLTAILIVALFLIVPNKAYALESVSKVLSNTSSGEGEAVATIWNRLMTVVNAFIVVLLIAIAFAEILRININTYGIKKVLPALVMAVLAAQFSLLFCKLLIDFANVLVNYFLSGINLLNTKSAIATALPNGSATAQDWGIVFWFIIGEILIIAGSIIVFILAYLFIIRNWMLYFLVALSPLAILATVLPQTKSLFNQWWGYFSKWTFMPVVSVFWLWVGTLWFNTSFGNGIYFINFVFAVVCFYLALVTPFKLGGAIMTAWGNYGKKVWGATAGNAWKYTGGAAMNDYKELWGLRARNWWAKQGSEGSAFNPLAIIARSGAVRKELISIEKRAQKDIQNDLRGRALKNRAVVRRTNMNRSLGGGAELAEKEMELNYLKTKKGQRWAENKKSYFTQLETLDNRLKREHGKQDLEFYAAEGVWAKDGRLAKVRDDALKAASLLEIHNAQVSTAKDEENKTAFSEMSNAFKLRNIKRLKDLQEKIRSGESTAKERSEYRSLVRSIRTSEGLSQEQLQERIDNYSSTVNDLVKNFRQKDDTIVLPYYLEAAFKLSPDKKSVIDINNADEVLGARGLTRIFRQLGIIVDNEKNSYLGKYSIAQIAKLLKEGDGANFTAGDIKKLMSGKGYEVAPRNRVNAYAALRAFWSAKSKNPNSAEASEFYDNMNEFLSSEQQQTFASKINTRIREQLELRYENDPDKDVKIANELAKNNLEFRVGVDDPGRYIKRILRTPRYRNSAVVVLDEDPIVGTAKPVANSFAGGAAVATQVDTSAIPKDAEVMSANVEAMAGQLTNAVFEATGKNISKVAKQISARAGEQGLSQILDQAFSSIHQAKRDTAEGFAKSIGILGKEGHLSPLDTEFLIRYMRTMRGKTSEQVKADLSKSRVVAKYVAPGTELQLDQNSIANYSGQADQIIRKIDMVDKLQVAGVVDQIRPYFSQVQRISSNPRLGTNPLERIQNITNQATIINKQITDGAKVEGDLARRVAEILTALGRAKLEINEVLTDKDRVQSILYDATKVGEAAVAAYQKNGAINDEGMEDALYENYSRIARQQRMGAAIKDETEK